MSAPIRVVRILVPTFVLTFTAVASVSCSGDDAGPAPSTTAAQRPSTTAEVDDGILRIGVLLPASGAGAPLGEPLLDAVELAVAEINQAGGVNGAAVELVAVDEGDTMATATKGVGELTDLDVDAVVGPASSRMALAVLGRLVDRDVFTCSPTASAISLASFPDDRLFVRTIPSDALQAVAMAEVVEGAGVASASVLAPDDDYGHAYADAIASALRTRGLAVTNQVFYADAEDEYAAAVFAALEPDPGAVAFVGNSVSGRAVLAALDDLVPAGMPVVVNDSLRRSTSVDPNPLVAVNDDIVGTSPRAAPSPGGLAWFSPVLAAYLGVEIADLPASFAANAYDCVSLIAIAAEAGGANDASTIANNVVGISSGGASCANFTACAGFLRDGRNIDVNGASGQLELDSAGDVTVAWFDRFRFDDEGRDVTVGELQVTV